MGHTTNSSLEVVLFSFKQIDLSCDTTVATRDAAADVRIESQFARA